ncbi:hypothetical protein E2C01_028325 [Portunus trituberculatus]|uniref:Uncharacterized protein n=1 Tax=Portunus trituberculatus TaxID=210409 RepID=A0A5B7EL28_PORTR|nr:hypothetical protein [Portunus trituberculatus]
MALLPRSHLDGDSRHREDCGKAAAGGRLVAADGRGGDGGAGSTQHFRDTSSPAFTSPGTSTPWIRTPRDPEKHAGLHYLHSYGWLGPGPWSSPDREWHMSDALRSCAGQVLLRMSHFSTINLSDVEELQLHIPWDCQAQPPHHSANASLRTSPVVYFAESGVAQSTDW